MSLRTHIAHRRASLLAIAGGAWVGFAVGSAQGQVAMEVEELTIALQAAQAKAGRFEREITSVREKNEHLGQALAAANAEGEHFRKAYQKLRERTEALGIAAIDPDPASLQGQYLKALSDYRLTLEENDQLVSSLGDLNAAVTAYMKTAINSNLKERLALEVAIREANGLVTGLAKPEPKRSAATLEAAKVVSLKAEYDLIVLNVGRVSGVQVGMPFQILRKDRPIGSALVIDVRDQICGIVVQDLVASNDPVKLGDVARVDADKQLTL